MTEYRTVRLLHQEINYQPKGFKGVKGDLMCRAGKTGTVLIHSHIEIGKGKHQQMSLALLNSGAIEPDKELLYKFVNDDLFGVRPHISTHFLESFYEGIYGRKHPALDAVPFNRHFTTANFDMYWPFDCGFEVSDVGTYNDGSKYMILWFKVGEDDEEMKLEHEWQWDMLHKTIENLENKKILNSAEWREKVKNKTLTNSEAAWLTLITLDRITNEEGLK